jgi:hypothetical protein
MVGRGRAMGRQRSAIGPPAGGSEAGGTAGARAVCPWAALNDVVVTTTHTRRHDCHNDAVGRGSLGSDQAGRAGPGHGGEKMITLLEARAGSGTDRLCRCLRLVGAVSVRTVGSPVGVLGDGAEHALGRRRDVEADGDGVCRASMMSIWPTRMRLMVCVYRSGRVVPTARWMCASSVRAPRAKVVTAITVAPSSLAAWAIRMVWELASAEGHLTEARCARGQRAVLTVLI